MSEGQGVKCNDCGTTDYKTNFIGDSKDFMDEHGVCFDCAFWLRVLKEKRRHVIVNGDAYVPSGYHEGGNKDRLGHGGAVFNFKMNDGTSIKSNNVWHRGKVPDGFKDRLPDNATIEAGDK